MQDYVPLDNPDNWGAQARVRDLFRPQGFLTGLKNLPLIVINSLEARAPSREVYPEGEKSPEFKLLKQKKALVKKVCT